MTTAISPLVITADPIKADAPSAPSEGEGTDRETCRGALFEEFRATLKPRAATVAPRSLGRGGAGVREPVDARGRRGLK